MFKLNLKIALRNLWKHKSYTFINVAGLTIGMASCILIFIFIRYHLSFDEQFANKDRIFRMVTYWKYTEGEEFQRGTPRPLPAAVRNDFSEVEQAGAIQGSGGILKIRDESGKEKIKTAEDVYYVEPQFFKIFDYKWLQGDPQQALSNPNTVALSEKMATRFFGDWRKAVGQTINFQNKTDLKVTGVFENVPENSSIPLKVVISYAGYTNPNLRKWGSVSSSSQCYVLLKAGTELVQMQAQLRAFAKKYNSDKEVGERKYFLQPLREIHHDERYGSGRGTMPMKQIWGLGIIGLFLLITACINFINLATAQAIGRSKEVGVRKVMGSLRSQLMVQFLTETLTITVFAVLLACAVTELALPGMASLFRGNVTFSLFAHPVIFVFLFGLVLLVSFLAGFYPALVISGFNPALAIKNKISSASSGGVGLRKALVIVQFSITVILIIATLVVLKQMNYMREKSLGFNPSAVALVDVPSDSLSLERYAGLKERVLKLPGVLHASFCSASPSSDSNNMDNFSFETSKERDFQVNTKQADEDYFKTFGLKIIAGKPLSKSDTLKEYVINETMLRKLNIPDPQQAIGKYLNISGDQKAQVVGVVKDFNNLNLREAISPIALSSSKIRSTTLAVKLQSGALMSTMLAIEKTWNDVFPEHVYGAVFMEDEIGRYYEGEQVMGTLFKVFAGTIIFISFIGLFGLISFIAAQRTREVAIRKVLGASNLELVHMLNGSFLAMVFVANLVACPLAYIFASKWLSGYTYRIELSIWPFLIAMLVSVVITLITVSVRSYQTALKNPVDALKYE